MAPDASEPTVAPTTPSPSNIVLWVHPRSTSTMFECMLLARSDFQVHHEPMGEAWYYGDERASTRFTDEQRKASGNADATYAQVRSRFLFCSRIELPCESAGADARVFIRPTVLARSRQATSDAANFFQR
jgi:hypothetical protein